MTCGARASLYGTCSNRDHPQGWNNVETHVKKLLIAAVICAFPYSATADMTGRRLKAHCERYPQQSELTLYAQVSYGEVLKPRAP